MLNSAESHPKILIVEDDIASYLFMKELLADLNYMVAHVNDGKDAVDFVKNNPEVRLILMDIRLPFMNGYEATLEIKKINPDIRIIGQTAYAMFRDKDQAIKAGFDDYLTKPLDPVKLIELVRMSL